MKTLIILRHAKSDWSSREANDHDRPLAARGRKAAKVMGRFLKQAGETPDSVVSSSAVRARTTAELAMKAGKWECKNRITDRLYNCSPSDALREIKAEPDSSDVLMIVGHEPTWSELTARLAGGAQIRFSTGAAVRLELPIERWAEAEFGMAEIVWFVTPKIVKKLLK